MANVFVSVSNTRVEDCESATGWSSIGGGAGGAAEPSFPYQGGNLYNRKITSDRGFYYTPTSDGGTTQNMTLAVKNTWLVKIIVTDYGGLEPTGGLRVRIGTGANVWHEYIVSGSNSPLAAFGEYNARGGMFFIPIDPNVVAYRDNTSGSPNLTAVNYFAARAIFNSSTAKSENVGLDAIDLANKLNLTGGDGASADGVWADFVDKDEGVINNRYGLASSAFGGAIIQAFGTWEIGGTTATEFTDLGASILWLDGMFAAGWSRVLITLENAANIIKDGSRHVGLGSTAVEDSRPDYTVTGISGTFEFTGSLENFRNITYTSACTIDGASLEFESLTQGNATIVNATLKINSAAGIAAIVNPNLSALTDSSIQQVGTGHALEITTPGTYTLAGLSFSGFGADETNSAAVYNNSGGAVTFNISGGNSPSVRNSAGSTTSVVNSITWTISGMAVGSELTIVRNSDDVVLFHVESTGSGTEIYGFDGILSGEAVRVLVHNTVDFEPVALELTMPSSDSELPISQASDRVYSNP